MAKYFFTKKFAKRTKFSAPISKPVSTQETDKDIVVEKKSKNKSKKKENNMDNERIQTAEAIAEELATNNVKVVKRERGLIERTESSKIILTEDNRQVLQD